MDRYLQLFLDFAVDIFPNIMVAVVICIAGFFITKLVLKLFKKGMDKGKMDFSLEKFFLNAIKIACYIIIVISALSQIGISTTGILACFSAAVAAIALALKDSLSNIACGIILLFSRPFVTGDLIEIDGEMGTVVQIDLIHTKICTFDHRTIMIPNSVISAKEVVNFSSTPYRRVDVTVPVSYGCDILLAKEIITRTVLSIDNVLTEPEPPFVRVNQLSDSSMDFVVRVWTKNDDYWIVYHDMLEKIMTALRNEGISIPYNQVDVHLV